jgi:hypothetical protein
VNSALPKEVGKTDSLENAPESNITENSPKPEVVPMETGPSSSELNKSGDYFRNLMVKVFRKEDGNKVILWCNSAYTIY